MNLEMKGSIAEFFKVVIEYFAGKPIQWVGNAHWILVIIGIATWAIAIKYYLLPTLKLWYKKYYLKTSDGNSSELTGQNWWSIALGLIAFIILVTPNTGAFLGSLIKEGTSIRVLIQAGAESFMGKPIRLTGDARWILVIIDIATYITAWIFFFSKVWGTIYKKILKPRVNDEASDFNAEDIWGIAIGIILGTLVVTPWLAQLILN